MTHIKYPNELAPPEFNNLGQRIVYEPSWQEEAMRQSALLHQALSRATVAEMRLSRALDALRYYAVDEVDGIGPASRLLAELDGKE